MRTLSKEETKYYNELLSAGVDKAWLDSQIEQGKAGVIGDSIGRTDVQMIKNEWSKESGVRQKSTDLDSRAPEFMKTNPSWANLTADQKEIAVYNYELQKANDEGKAKALAEALEQATTQADPYWKNIIRIAQDEVLRGFEASRGDYESSLKRQQQRIEEINKDLLYNKDYLTLEQQNELSNLAKSYEVNYENLAQGAANQGLTFSTKRQIAQKRLAESNQGMVESTNRQYNKQMRDLQEEASRGSLEAQQQITDLQRKAQEATTEMGRSAEKYLGTENLPQLEGYNPLGNISGDLYEEKTKDIEARKNAIYNDLTQSSLNV